MSNLIRHTVAEICYRVTVNKSDILEDRRGVGSRLQGARMAKGLSQKEIADRFGVDKATVSAWETGRGDPGVYRLKELAKLYNFSADAILWDGAPSMEAMRFAAEFDALTERQKSTLRAIWLAFISESSSDSHVENSMPITKAENRPTKKEKA